MSSPGFCSFRKSHYSAEEQSFADSWLDSAEYVAAAHFHSNLEKSVLFLNPLPSRILRVLTSSLTYLFQCLHFADYSSIVFHSRLQAGDASPNIADLTEEENYSLTIFSWMKNINTILGRTHNHKQNGKHLQFGSLSPKG